MQTQALDADVLPVETGTPRYSIVMPVHNAAPHLREVLDPLMQLDEQWEIVLVDDGSSDATPDIVSSYPYRTLVHSQVRGQSAARNWGVGEARGNIVVFVDSDVVTTPQTLRDMVWFLETRPDLDGVFGSYSNQGNRGERSISRFRNLMHRYVHQISAGPAASFWAGLGAIRRDRFLSSGAFDSRLDGIEDVELGIRVTRSGGSLWIEPRFEGIHRKRWTWRSVIYTDMVVRAARWTYFGWRGLTPRSGLNLTLRFTLPPLLLVLGLGLLPTLPKVGAALFAAYFLLNFHLYRYCQQSAGLSLALKSVVYLAIHQLCCVAGAALGTLRYLHQRLAE